MTKSRISLYIGIVMSMFLFSFAFIATGSLAATNLTEGFEAGGKSAYAPANVTLGSGSWYMDDALTGNTTSDHKTGSYAARVRNTGTVRMNFNVASAGTVTVQHAEYGTDGSSTWELWESVNNGSSWSKVGSTMTTGSTSLATASFTVNSPSSIRFELLKISGGANRINFDNITVTSYTAPTPTPTPTPTATPTPNPSPTPTPSTNVNLTMGNPSNAITDVAQPLNYLMEQSTYCISYNRDDRRPNWASWHLDSTWLGSTPRQDDFRPNPALPSAWYHVLATDYSGSGYDRGHMCPSGDRTKTVSDNSSTFLMTNMVPQAPDNNQITWAGLESYCRTLAGQGNELYIIAGGLGNSGFVGPGMVALPTYTWKVIMVLPSGTNDVSRVTTSTRLIAVMVPNQNGISSDWRTFRTSVDQVEAMTGYDFFSNVDPAIQSVIEAKVDTMAPIVGNGRMSIFDEVGLDAYAQAEAAAESKINPTSKKR